MQLDPVRGLDSYRIEDAIYFFGRDGDSERLVSRILSSGFMLLHARSEAGKTSLIQAKTTLDLERLGWTVVVVLPARDPIRGDPVRAVIDGVIRALIPPPSVELDAIERACEELCPGVPADPLTLGSVVARYDAFQPRGQRPEVDRQADIAESQARQKLSTLQRPIKLDLHDGSDPVSYYALFDALLRGGIEPEQYLAHLSALCGQSAPPAGGGEETTVQEIRALLTQSSKGSYKSLLGVLNSPSDTLASFFTRLFSVYGGWRPDLQVVLVMDQFEELFNLYGDADGTASSDGGVYTYVLRDQFFLQLQSLYFLTWGRRIRGLRKSQNQQLPLACVISIRQEFIADLDPVRAFVGDLDQGSFHLDRLTDAAAQSVLETMTSYTHWPFGRGLARRLAIGLTREGQYVDPAELQVVTELILNELVAHPEGRNAEAVYEALGRSAGGSSADDRELVRNILDRFFNNFLDSVVTKSDEASQRDRVRVELLEILQTLVTDRGKAPAPVSSLVAAPFRDPDRRGDLLKDLVKGRLIRVESRGGIDIAEIRHDFLIKPILRAVREGLLNEQHGRLIAAQALLSFRRRTLSDDLTRNLLTRREFEEIAKHRESLDWGYTEPGWQWTPGELMLRSALSFATIKPEELADCARLMTGRKGRQGEFRVPNDWRTNLLDRQRLATIDASPQDWQLSTEQLLVVIKSQLEHGEETERHLIEYWVDRWRNLAERKVNAATAI
jgi:hypothetical protein